MSLTTLEDMTIPRDAAHTMMQTEFLPCRWMRRRFKLCPFSLSTSVVSVQKAAVPVVTLVAALFLSGLHPWSLLCSAAWDPHSNHFPPCTMSAAGGFLASPGILSWQGSDSAGCSGFLEQAMVLCYTLLGYTNGAFCSLKGSFHIYPTHYNKCSWNIFKCVCIHMCSDSCVCVGIYPCSSYSSACFKGGSSVW